MTGTYSPTNFDDRDTFPGAPPGPYASTLSAFRGTNAQGSWRLFIVDDGYGNSHLGNLHRGWSLVLSTSAGDFVSTSGTLLIPAGSNSGNIGVTIPGDTKLEPTETFTVTLSSPAGATIVDGSATGTIVDDDVNFANHPLTSGVTPVRAAHILELRTAANALRAERGLAPVAFSEPGLSIGQTIRAYQVRELRAALPPDCAPAFTDPVLVPGETPLRAAHIVEIRRAVIECP